MTFAEARERMVREQIEARGISDARVKQAMRDVPREAFVPESLKSHAYDDRALPIEAAQTISQPYIVALMAEAATIGPEDKVLEVGAGSGYAAAVLSRLAAEVVAIERHAELADLASRRLTSLGYANVRVLAGDGTRGFPDEAPFDAILVPAAGGKPPQALLDQLADGGRLVMPVGGGIYQTLIRLTRTPAGFARDEYGSVAFVPLIADRD
ncbi:protein-L-isoaspartate(D-aspartate) O-methyltransferase [Sphingomonas tabacisoli]|uniref:Protein-L-isoaspartate O-methyltransferase n=1 Tax=Sphingomonas tabacisoli TaxID=2249466 RepID=A0ABW4I2N5_9SPHN